MRPGQTLEMRHLYLARNATFESGIDKIFGWRRRIHEAQFSIARSPTRQNSRSLLATFSTGVSGDPEVVVAGGLTFALEGAANLAVALAHRCCEWFDLESSPWPSCRRLLLRGACCR